MYGSMFWCTSFHKTKAASVVKHHLWRQLHKHYRAIWFCPFSTTPALWLAGTVGVVRRDGGFMPGCMCFFAVFMDSGGGGAWLLYNIYSCHINAYISTGAFCIFLFLVLLILNMRRMGMPALCMRTPEETPPPLDLFLYTEYNTDVNDVYCTCGISCTLVHPRETHPSSVSFKLSLFPKRVLNFSWPGLRV